MHIRIAVNVEELLYSIPTLYTCVLMLTNEKEFESMNIYVHETEMILRFHSCQCGAISLLNHVK